MRAPIASTPPGRIAGREIETPDGVALEFLGIPVARADRFRPARLVDAWSGIADCTLQGPIAFQEPARAAGLALSEDCLNANVWVPAASESPLPVIVWIHGGAHLYGSNATPLCNGARLAAAENVMVVAVNYRLGVLGHLFLDHLLPELAGSGNRSLGDLVAALEWLSSSADSFGGDPARVTIMGQSAGGVNALALLSSGGANQLFQRVIVESATAERTWTTEQAAVVTDLYLAELGRDRRQAADLFSLPAAELIAAQESLIRRRSEGNRSIDLPFRPVVDGNLLQAIPLEAIGAGEGSHIDLLIGSNTNEASGWIDTREPDSPEQAAAFEEETQRALSLPAAQYRSALERYTQRSASTAEAREALLADELYRQPVLRVLDARAAAPGRTYAYQFDWRKPSGEGWPRLAGHSLELPFVFRHIDDSSDALDEVGEDAPSSLRDTMSSRWAEFARSGAPATDGSWPEYGPDRTTQVLGTPTRLVDAPREELRRLFAGRTTLADSSTRR